MSLLKPQRTRPWREVEIKERRKLLRLRWREHLEDIYCTLRAGFQSVGSMYYFTLPRIVLCQLFLTGKTSREIGKGILCIPTKWQALAFNHRVYGVKLLSIEMYEFAAPGMGRILFTLKTILEGSLLEIEFRLRLQTAFLSHGNHRCSLHQLATAPSW